MGKKKSLIILVTVVLALLGLLVVESKAHFPRVNAVIMAVVAPVNSTMRGIADFVSNTTGYFQALDELQTENKKIQKENELLRQENIQLLDTKSQNKRLTQLLGYKTTHPEFKYAVGKVIGRDVGELSDTVIVNLGSDDGIKMHMPVINGIGLVGIVDGVFPQASRILLVSSAHTRIGGMDLRGDSRIAGIVTGMAGGDGKLLMKNMSRTADLLPGDSVVTSGYSGYHPAGILIGTIQDIQLDIGGLTKEATIMPAVDFSRLEEIMIITNFQGHQKLLEKIELNTAKKGAEQ